jgi:hypothetical protein
MFELLELIKAAHIKLNTSKGYILRESQNEFEDIYKASKVYADISRLNIGELCSRLACGFWEQDKSDCITSITKFIERGSLTPDTAEIGFFAAWVNDDIQHPKIEELARYFVKHRIFEYSLDMQVSEYVEQKYKKPAYRPTNDIIHCLDSLMGFFETRSIQGAEDLLGVDRKTIRKNLKRLVVPDYKVVIDIDYIFYDSIKELHESWKVKRQNNQ